MACFITFLFIVLDFITGLICALTTQSFSSSVMRQGLSHKLGSCIAVVLGILADYSQHYLDLGINIPVCTAICTYIVLMEIGSIIENIGIINPNILPRELSKFFTKLNDNEKE